MATLQAYEKATNCVLSFLCLSRSGHPFGVCIHLLILSSTKRRMDINEASNMFYCKFNQLVCFAIAIFLFSPLCCYYNCCSLFIRRFVRRSLMENVKCSTLFFIFYSYLCQTPIEWTNYRFGSRQSTSEHLSDTDQLIGSTRVNRIHQML